ncbi:MAG TPA: HNH endonuclease signature motif containing protein [Candidatus Acidoferrum sp.]|jgi:hypothetical protein|nr:HNH endonuclease signature motif containing protein [Candidatus Acidoferrum sp.]
MPRRKSKVVPYDPQVIGLLQLPERSRPSTVKRVLKAVFRTLCKPCWELKYCPYGRLVERFPLPRIIRSDAIRHIEFLKQQLSAGAYDAIHKKAFSAEVKNFDTRNFPERIPDEEEFMRCHIFGHYCPVFFMGEPFTETGDLRKGDSSVSFQTKLRVARRDNYTCQECGRLLREHELEFDHIIPRSLGGTSDEYNIRLTCLKCNRKKGKKVNL